MDPKVALQNLVNHAGELKLSKNDHATMIQWAQIVLEALSKLDALAIEPAKEELK